MASVLCGIYRDTQTNERSGCACVGVCACVQWDPCNVDTHQNEKHVLIIGVSSFQGEVKLVNISRIG